MAIIRFNTDDVFSTDSSEYEILINATKKVDNTPGAIVEIGSRRGGSAKMIIDALVETNNTDRLMICIDPYGNIDCTSTNISLSAYNPHIDFQGEPNSTDKHVVVKYDYNNDMRNRVIPSLYYYAFAAGLNFQFLCLEDMEYFVRYADGFPIYNNEKRIEDKYALVFLDAPHINEVVKNETEFFCGERTTKGSLLVYDDLWHYSHDKVIEPILFENGFEIFEKGTVKASYIKTK